MQWQTSGPDGQPVDLRHDSSGSVRWTTIEETLTRDLCARHVCSGDWTTHTCTHTLRNYLLSPRACVPLSAEHSEVTWLPPFDPLWVPVLTPKTLPWWQRATLSVTTERAPREQLSLCHYSHVTAIGPCLESTSTTVINCRIYSTGVNFLLWTWQEAFFKNIILLYSLKMSIIFASCSSIQLFPNAPSNFMCSVFFLKSSPIICTFTLKIILKRKGVVKSFLLSP